MYAVIETGGKQYRVRVGEEVLVERLAADEGPCTFDEVLLVADDEGGVRVGTPTVPGAVVRGTVLGEEPGPKIVGFKYKPKVNYRRRYGHRQTKARVRIEAIEG
jgi:large subunit ribosomal protein L21